jgi:hypothetical protein
MVELRPAWYYGEPSGEPGWDVEGTIDADCRHKKDHGGMDPVFRGEIVHATDPEEAARALLDVAVELHRPGNNSASAVLARQGAGRAGRFGRDLLM